MKRFLRMVAAVALIAAGCSSGPIGVDADSIAGTWNAVTYAYLESADLDNLVELISQGASFTVTFTADGTFVWSFRDPVGVVDSRSGTFTVSPDAVIAFLANGEDEPVLFLATREEDRLQLQTGLTEWDFEQDGTPEPAEWRIFLTREP
jgi:hypothetical protein